MITDRSVLPLITERSICRYIYIYIYIYIESLTAISVGLVHHEANKDQCMKCVMLYENDELVTHY